MKLMKEMAPPSWTLQWSLIPWDLLPLSCKIDISLWLCALKPAVRIIIKQKNYRKIKKAFERLFPSQFYIFQETVLYLAPTYKDAFHLCEVDNLFEPHESDFGGLLGYPSCCTSYIETLGERRIDEIEKERFLNYSNPQSLTDTLGYSKGKALISHVPCHLDCGPSQALARCFHSILYKEMGPRLFLEWKHDVLDFFSALAV